MRIFTLTPRRSGAAAMPQRQQGPHRRPISSRVGIILMLAQLMVFCHYLPSRAEAAETVFTSTAEVKREASRLSDEGKLFITAPADPYLLQTAAVAGAFAITYAYDRDIRSDLAGSHSGALSAMTDVASAAGNTLVHFGVAAALYGAGAAADAPRVQLLGQELGEALILADGATFVLREAVGRGRPQTGDGNSRYRPLQFKSDYDSLPSMHTASSFAVAHVLASKTESLPVKILCYAGAAFVGFSRIYKDEHWASDIVLGAAIGELAGNSVTRYYGMHEGGLVIAPAAVGGVPSLALSGRF